MSLIPLISVVLPIFNVELYLRECLDSILSQSYENLEIILVDDGSSDNSGNICDEYEKKDDRITVIHKENGGVSSARNKGIEASNGLYISFIDADDIIEPDFFSYLLNAIRKTGADIAYCSYCKISEEGSILNYPPNADDGIIETYSSDDAVINSLKGQNGFDILIWRALFKKDVISYFVEGRHRAEDQDFTVRSLLNAKAVALTHGVKYKYRVRYSGSRNMGKSIVSACQYSFGALEDIRKCIETHSKNENLLQAYYYRGMLTMLTMIDDYCTKSVEKDKKIFNDFRSKLKYFTQNAYPGIKGKLLSIIFSANESLFKFAFKLSRRFQGF